MTTLFSYVIPNDHGAAPNPFWGVCTLVICKPKIRRAAQVGDWIAGTGSACSPIGDVQGRLVYAMQVTRKMTMSEYDAWAQEYRQEKVPAYGTNDPRRTVGDALYDFSMDPPPVRPGVHGIAEREHDLSGEYALLSEHFFYFGDQPMELPEHLKGLVKRGPGHRAPGNAAYLEPFVEWISGLGFRPNSLNGKPQGGPLARNRTPDVRIQDIRRR